MQLPWPRSNCGPPTACVAPRVPAGRRDSGAIGLRPPHGRAQTNRSCQEIGAPRPACRRSQRFWGRHRPLGHTSRARRECSAAYTRKVPMASRATASLVACRAASSALDSASARRPSASKHSAFCSRHCTSPGTIARRSSARAKAASFLSANNAAMLPRSQPAESAGHAARHPAAAAAAASNRPVPCVRQSRIESREVRG